MNPDPVYRAGFRQINTLELVEGQKKATTETAVVECTPVKHEVKMNQGIILYDFEEDHRA